MRNMRIIAAGMVLLCCFAACTAKEEPQPDGGGGQGAEEEIGGDWTTWRSYSAAYTLAEDVEVVFSGLDEGEGFGVYEADSGVRVGSLLLEGDTTQDATTGEFIISDRDGDGINDIGVEMTDGTVLWYRYNPDTPELWPDNPQGPFDYICKDEEKA